MRKKDIFEENKELQSSLFLAQSYQDAWADYSRSLKKERFVVTIHGIDWQREKWKSGDTAHYSLLLVRWKTVAGTV